MLILLAAAWLALPEMARADAGVLIPRDKEAPDAAVLSLSEMKVDIVIDNGDARIRIVQIFANHTGRIEEGTYVFALPDRSTVSDFAVWDGPVRIPAVILERKRAEEIYEQAKMQAIDPGLLEMGERSDADAKKTSTFSAKIVPIPAWGTKRLELEYHQKLTVNDWKQFFSLPLKPDAYQQQAAGHFTLHFVLRSAHAMQEFQLASKHYALKMEAKNDAHAVEGSFEGSNVALDEDFAATWKLDAGQADALDVIAYRNPVAALPSPDEMAPEKAARPEPGFFQAEVLIGEGKSAEAGKIEGNKPDANKAEPNPDESRAVIVLLDNSVSMQWEKLERSYAATEALLRQLRPMDRFNLILFNQDVSLFKPEPVTADAAAVQQALEFVRSSRLRGGTDIGKALSAGLKQCTAENCALVLLTDGESDRGETVLTNRIAANYVREWKRAAHAPKTDVFAVGDDANLPLLKLLAANGGVMEHVLSTEPIEYKLNTFLSKMVRSPVGALSLTTDAKANIKMVYPLDDAVYTRSPAAWVGQYSAPAKGVQFHAHAARDGSVMDAKVKADLPAQELDHPQLPRLWAQARVNALLDQIAREGESRVAIDEIIRLARKYKLVTPYTSFLAVPRSLLRPRVIRPGDPVIRVRTDPAIESVIALFPFGLTKPLRHLADEDTPGEDGGRLWETRFLVPTDMRDGTYNVQLILRDTGGNTYREAKTFVIASTPPTVKIRLERTQVHAGEALQVKATASATARTLTARLDGAAPASLRWSSAAGANVGTLQIPAGLATGRYTLTVTAEDIAHNIGSEEVQVEVLP
ncbi:MAG TPA: VIT domain-containing protein [Acidobacteriaceae bacterium]|jgi:Ca-activated chloride channel family protein|nr:VIT domain-containing protein [Acidobacteriaceae bacterium]